MSPEKGKMHELQEQPPEGDRDVIDRELARSESDEPSEAGERKCKQSKTNPEATPGTGMLPPTDSDDDPNMAPTG